MPGGLQVENATKTFGTVSALRQCSFTVPGGSVSALIGLNGSGKTTVLRAAAGMLRLDNGSITVDGSSVVFAQPGPLSYLAQSKPLHSLLRPPEVVSYAHALASGRFDRRLALDWLARYQVPLDRTVGQLSGGQRTQVALAAAVARAAPAVALDEPMADLDPLAREQVADDLRAAAQAGRTILVSSHAITELSGWCDHVVVIDRGHVILQGASAEIAGGADLAGVIREAMRAAQRTAQSGAEAQS
ncbi:MAG TPA: ATP-binding cassette domain-containing protein [Streptosporangiaceae bacterium]